MDSLDGEQRRSDGQPCPPLRNLHGNKNRQNAAIGDVLRVDPASPGELVATKQFLQALFKSVVTAIMLFLAGSLAASEILHPFTHKPDGSHKTPPIQNTTRREDRGNARVKIQLAEDEGNPDGSPPLVPCEGVGVGCKNREPSGFCHLRQHLCIVAPHPDSFMELQQTLKRVLGTFEAQGAWIDRLVLGQEKILAAEPRRGYRAIEPVTDNEARRLFALLRALELESNFRKAPVTRVFMLYCLDGKSRDAVARDCQCSPALITLRLQAIGRKLGRKPSELRQFSDYFERIADSLSGSRARRIHGQSSMS